MRGQFRDPYHREMSAVTTGIFRIRETRKGKLVAQRQRFVETWIRKRATRQCVASQVVLIPARQLP
jgi:hypothetical protein